MTIKRSFRKLPWHRALCLGLVLFLISCSPEGQAVQLPQEMSGETNMEASFFTIHFFRGNNPVIPTDIHFGDENSWRKLLSIDLNKNDLLLTENNIVSYDWVVQKIITTDEFRAQYDSGEPHSSDYSWFVIALDGEAVCGGGILPEISTVGAKIPVIYVSSSLLHAEHDNLELLLRPNAFDKKPLFPVNDPTISERIQQHFSKVGKLIE